MFLHSNMGARYKREIQSLIGMLGVNEKRQEAILILRKLVNQITASPKAENPKALNIDLYRKICKSIFVEVPIVIWLVF